MVISYVEVDADALKHRPFMFVADDATPNTENDALAVWSKFKSVLLGVSVKMPEGIASVNVER